MLQRDVLLACLFESDQELMRACVLQAAPRVCKQGVPSKTPECMQALINKSAESMELLSAVFLVLLLKDMPLKETVLNGIPSQRLKGMHAAKAERFFGYLETDVVMPWLIDERSSCAQMLEKAREMYLVS